MRFNNSHALTIRAGISIVVALAAVFTAPLVMPLSAQATHPTTTTAHPMTPVATPTIAGPAAPKATPADLANNHPTPPAGSSAPTVMPEAGIYTLAMTATTINGHAAGSTHVMSENVGVSWSGAVISIGGNGMAFKGQVANNHLSASSHTPEGNITLDGTPAAHYASGTFTLRQPDGNNANGGFTLTPPSQQHTARKVKEYGGNTPAPANTCSVWCSIKNWWAGFSL